MSKLNVRVSFPTWGFRSLGIPHLPPLRGEGGGDQKNPKVILEYCNTIKIILNKFVIVFYKNLFKIKKINC